MNGIMIKSRICEMLGITYPVFQGGMAWLADASLAAAVSNAGGLGLISSINAGTEAVRNEIRKCRELTDKPFGVNIMLQAPNATEVAQMVVEEGVKIDRLVGAFSGIPSEVQLMTGYVSEKYTSKVPFEFTSEDGKNFEGTLHIFGLFPPANESQIAGPGILTLSIQASAEEDGTKHSTIFYNNVNMKKEIEAAEIMILTEDRSAYRFSDTENTDAQGAYLEIKDFNLKVSDSNVDKITRYMVVSGKGQGFNKWKPVEGNEDKDENPGLTPEV